MGEFAIIYGSRIFDKAPEAGGIKTRDGGRMIVILKPEASEELVKEIVSQIEAAPGTVPFANLCAGNFGPSSAWWERK